LGYTIGFCEIGYFDSENFFYDVWGNIEFGYLGRAAGVPARELVNGAALEQPVSTIASRRRPTWGDDPSDAAGIRIGMELYETRAPLTRERVLNRLYERRGELNKYRHDTQELYR
jgi:hypothetical protein